MAKGRSASLRQTTILRMELQVAVLAVRLSALIKKELRIAIASVEYHTDSQIVLWQLRSDDPGRPSFVRARREEILAHSALNDWHFVRSSDNPADECTRGVTPKDFGPGCRWITGPSFLMDPSYVAEPFDHRAIKPSEKKDDETPTVSIGHLDVTPYRCQPKAAAVSKLTTRAAELSLLKREVAQLVRRDPTTQAELTVGELAEALRVCLLVSQSEVFVRECKALLNGTEIPRDSVLRRVGPYIDPDLGQMKVDGGLEHADLPARTRHPTIIAPTHPLTKLIIEDCHQKVRHSGVEHTLSILREQYYVPQGRRAIRRTLRKCVKCKLLRSLPKAPKMASLPKERLQAFLRVFTNVGLDCFGPFQVVIGRRSVKRYGLLITCLSSRAVHLEVLDSMDADSFIMAIRRFISLRGSPAVVYSDNGTNLKAGGKELAKGIKNLNSIRVSGEMADRGIDWRYSPPTGSHYGGIWERLIGSSKAALRAILETRSVNDEVLRTVFAEIASLLNSRPLTSNHFMLGGRILIVHPIEKTHSTD